MQRAFTHSYEDSARILCENYLDNVDAFCCRAAVHDPVTGEELEPDEKFMRSIEEQIGITENTKKAFREEILIRISAGSRKGRRFDFTRHPRLREAIEKKLLADLKDVIKITTSTRNPDPLQVKRTEDVRNRLTADGGFCPVCAVELLRYVGGLLNR